MTRNSRFTGSRLPDPRSGFLLLIAGGLGLLVTQVWNTVGPGGLTLPGLTPGGTWLAFHLGIEAVAIVMVLVGLLTVGRDLAFSGRLERVGFAVTVAACILLVPTHVLEHFVDVPLTSGTIALGPLAIPVGFGIGGLSYYGNWAIFAAATFLLGVGVLWRETFPPHVAALFVLPATVGTVGGVLAAASGMYPFLGVHRLVHGILWAGVGSHLYLGHERTTPTGSESRLEPDRE